MPLPLRGAVGENDGFEEFSADIAEIPEGMTVSETFDIEDDVLKRGYLSTVGELTFTIPLDVTSIGEDAFYYNLVCTTLNIPSNIISIGPRAFFHNSKLASLFLDNGVMHIGGNAFYNCERLRVIILPSTLQSIEVGAFSECGDGTLDIYYTGAEEQWDQITIAEGAIPEYATIHYNYIPE